MPVRRPFVFAVATAHHHHGPGPFGPGKRPHRRQRRRDRPGPESRSPGGQDPDRRRPRPDAPAAVPARAPGAGQRRGRAPSPASRRKATRRRSISASSRSSSIPGKRALRTEIGRTGEDMAEAELDRVRLLVAARVKRAYWTAAFAGGAAEALERSIGRLDALLEDLQSKYRTGAAAYADVLRARAEKARLRNQVLEQAKEKRAAELELDRAPGTRRRRAHRALDARCRSFLSPSTRRRFWSGPGRPCLRSGSRPCAWSGPRPP